MKSKHAFKPVFSTNTFFWHLLPSLVFNTHVTDNPINPHRARTFSLALNFIVWHASLSWCIRTPRHWTESEFWKDKPEELAEARRVEAEEREAMAEAQAKRVRKMAQRVMKRINLNT